MIIFWGSIVLNRKLRGIGEWEQEQEREEEGEGGRGIGGKGKGRKKRRGGGRKRGREIEFLANKPSSWNNSMHSRQFY